MHGSAKVQRDRKQDANKFVGIFVSTMNVSVCMRQWLCMTYYLLVANWRCKQMVP
jgi:hypothetical protein